MIVKDPYNYNFLGFRQSTRKNKKYDAILQNKETNKLLHVPFGDIRYQQYEDKTPLKLYTSLNHYDEDRRSNYLKRHESDIANRFSSGWFASHFLW